MTREEYLYKLRKALEGELPEYEIEEHIRYYNQYLSDSEDTKALEDKLRELGDPRLIAKTIIDTKNTKTSYDYDSQEENTQENHNSFKIYRWDTLTWYQKLLAVIIGLLVLAAIIGIFVVGVNIFFSVILPILIVIFFVKLIISVIKK